MEKISRLYTIFTFKFLCDKKKNNKTIGTCFFLLATQVMCDPNGQSLGPQELLLLSLSTSVNLWLVLWGCNPVWRLQQLHSASFQALQPLTQTIPLLSLSMSIFCSVRVDPIPPFCISTPRVSRESEGMVNKGLLQRERVSFGKKTLCKLTSYSQTKLGKERAMVRQSGKNDKEFPVLQIQNFAFPCSHLKCS